MDATPTRRPLLTLLALAAACSGACKKEADPEHAVRYAFVKERALAEDAGAAWRLTSNDRIVFDDGWEPLETEKGVRTPAWRWMGRAGVLRLRRHDVPMRLSITGYVPLHILGASPTMTLRWNGVRVDTFLAPAGHFTRHIDVSLPMQEGSSFSDFAIETSTVGQERNDGRDLGFAITNVRWERADADGGT